TETEVAVEDRKQAEKDLRESERTYLALFNGMVIGIGLHEMLFDESNEPWSFRFVEVNPAFESITGLQRDKILGRTAREVFPELDRTWVESFAQVLEGDPVSFQRTIPSLDKTVQVSAFKYKRNHFCATFTDVTERRRMEEALHRSKEIYEAVVQDQTELICRCRPDGTLTFANDAYCRYFGKGVDDLVAHSFMSLIPEDDYERVRKMFSSIGRTNPVVTYRHRLLFPDGRLRWQEWTDRAVFDDGGAIVEYQSVGRDVTDHQKAEEDLQKYKTQLESIVEERTASLRESNEQLQAEIGERRRAEEEGSELQHRLQDALSRALSGYLAICSSCKRIRDDEGNWIPLEMYMLGRTEAEFTHGVCPYCMKKLYPDLHRREG
ncbi:MAG: PAS domain S-box protein, partial [Lentisphaerae bacterium]|nr:PAS domain S-box protein [Lentisphaerota bacterium]